MLQQYDPRNAAILININAELLPRDLAGISPFDSAVQGGDAVWEGLRVYNGRIFKLHEHLARLESSAKALAFDIIPPRDDIIEQIRRTLAGNDMRDGVHIRLTLTRGVKVTSGMDPRLNQSGPTLIILAEHKPPVYDTSGLSLVTSSVRRFPPDCLDPKIHHCNLIQSILAKIEANVAGADDAIMLDTRGFVAETNATHIFMVTRVGQVSDLSSYRVATSRLVACPEGITRETVLEICVAESIPHEVRDISLTELYRADEVFCTGTMGELAGVTTIDGRTIGDGQVGPTTRRLSELYGARTSNEGVQVA
jgi:branched-chain amino acid aminotransferase